MLRAAIYNQGDSLTGLEQTKYWFCSEDLLRNIREKQGFKTPPYITKQKEMAKQMQRIAL